MKKLLNVIKKIICVFGGIILILVIQASISSILRLINPIEEPAEEKKELEVEAVYTASTSNSFFSSAGSSIGLIRRKMDEILACITRIKIIPPNTHIIFFITFKSFFISLPDPYPYIFPYTALP